MSPPLVSVVMSVYNEEDYLKDTIESILNQTLQDFEFIIVNDGSTDKTQEILDGFAQTDRRIIVKSGSKNISVAAALNIGIAQASGKYVAIMDAGDISRLDRLEKQAKFLEEREDIYILGTQGCWINTNYKKIGLWRLPLEVSDKDVYNKGGAIHPSIMVRRELFDRIGLYDPELQMSQEFEIYLRALKNGLSIANLADPLIYALEREKGMTLSHLKMIQKNQLEIKLKYLKYFPRIMNVFYTIRSWIGCMLPRFILAFIAKLQRR